MRVPSGAGRSSRVFEDASPGRHVAPVANAAFRDRALCVAGSTGTLAVEAAPKPPYSRREMRGFQGGGKTSRSRNHGRDGSEDSRKTLSPPFSTMTSSSVKAITSHRASRWRGSVPSNQGRGSRRSHVGIAGAHEVLGASSGGVSPRQDLPRGPRAPRRETVASPSFGLCTTATVR